MSCHLFKRFFVGLSILTVVSGFIALVRYGIFFLRDHWNPSFTSIAQWSFGIILVIVLSFMLGMLFE
jgi:hypothetical protein